MSPVRFVICLLTAERHHARSAQSGLYRPPVRLFQHESPKPISQLFGRMSAVAPAREEVRDAGDGSSSGIPIWHKHYHKD